jgi:formylglycine-generating enzyme
VRSALAFAVLLISACSQSQNQSAAGSKDAGVTPASRPASAPSPAAKPELLYLPDADLVPQAPSQELLPYPWGFTRARCPPEMVDIRGQFCIDRFEASLVDTRFGRPLSPYYHPVRGQLSRCYTSWQKRRLESGTPEARLIPVPPPPEWQLAEEFQPSARSQPGLVPSGYLNGRVAEQACRNAGKRLCRSEEWTLACRGSRNRKFPYGDTFRPGACNIGRQSHPARVLHGDASIHHLDPRLNLVKEGDEPLLRKTGATPGCASDWGEDAVFDMVGNLDEWIEDPDGTFAGGFYARATEDGCEARITSHESAYLDYSLGTRCCK